jgi:hypothetical protein
LDFLKENAAENILQGGYQVCSDTMLGNMISKEGMRENSRLFLLMIKVNITNDEVIPLMRLLQVYILVLQTSI